MHEMLAFFNFIINNLTISWSCSETEHIRRPAQVAGTTAIGLPRCDAGPRTILPGIEMSADKAVGSYPRWGTRFSVPDVNIEKQHDGAHTDLHRFT
jgi:hypothetical protein